MKTTDEVPGFFEDNTPTVLISKLRNELAYLKGQFTMMKELFKSTRNDVADLKVRVETLEDDADEQAS